MDFHYSKMRPLTKGGLTQFQERVTGFTHEAYQAENQPFDWA